MRSVALVALVILGSSMPFHASPRGAVIQVQAYTHFEHAEVQCMWVSGVNSQEGPTAQWGSILPDRLLIGVTRTDDNGLLEECFILIHSKRPPIKCYGYTAHWCDETYVTAAAQR